MCTVHLFNLLFISRFILFFRILNKLSPEKFDKLSLELLNVGIESQVILKGIILLVSNNRYCLFCFEAIETLKLKRYHLDLFEFAWEYYYYIYVYLF